MQKIILFVLVIASAGGIAFYKNQQLTSEQNNTNQIKANGRIELTRYYVQALYGGRVENLSIEEGQNIQKGDNILELKTDEIVEKRKVLEAAKKRAEQQVIRAKSAAERAENIIKRSAGAAAQSKAQTQSLQAQLAIAENDLKNAQKLRKDNLISASELTQRQKSKEAQTAAVKAAKAGEVQTNSAEEEAKSALKEALAAVHEAEAAVEQTDAEIAALDATIKEMQIKAQVSGRVEYVTIKEGQVVGGGQILAAIVNPEEIELDIFLSLAQLARVQINQAASIKIEGFEVEMPAKIIRIADNAQFTPKYVETANERAKLLYRVTLKIDEKQAAEYKNFMRGGVPAVAVIKI
ncbi:MAG: HlyD family efflux transporter periplasmic adaptor subunit [Cardiobacteriaceae bacterium]|nr:HlyD family efflux transporter periplasmic adaptor subunit [Cardiobacteriaceae bacterium]